MCVYFNIDVYFLKKNLLYFFCNFIFSQLSQWLQQLLGAKTEIQKHICARGASPCCHSSWNKSDLSPCHGTATVSSQCFGSVSSLDLVWKNPHIQRWQTRLLPHFRERWKDEASAIKNVFLWSLLKSCMKIWNFWRADSTNTDLKKK